ncbi:DUF262 domain-containing protein [Kosakonia sp. MUSA4]|uniref:DUF262 domain-containing protein n=1 Tax=Kosakonia sp. MUSA4 TaxID=2067958 RepID=UPI001597211D|nr:DUF262 domain-containing protein [Kosakonia sp. MUSA4]QJT81937.1 hypothetical protein C0557_18615 [Kosakonia sp. MUSA4]
METNNIIDENALSVSESDDHEIIEFNEEIVSDDPVTRDDLEGLVIYSRDWTIETIISQIEANNIDLNPSFQRRNVWENDKRSKLIESLIVGYPVPEVVLAEIPSKKKQYVVIDGKQRLLAIHGFFKPENEYWKGKAELKGLTIRKDLDGSSIDSFDADDLRLLKNADLRCTILSGYKTTSVLYDVFYRLNTGSVPLSMQELRNSLHKGEFSKFITNKTNAVIPLHHIMSLSGPDKRFKDIEIILKFLSINFSNKKYNSNLKDFLDTFTEYANESWNDKHNDFEQSCTVFDSACSLLIEIFGGPKKVGRKWLPAKETWESRFNRSLFEVLAQYAYFLITDGHDVIFDDSAKKDDFCACVKKAFEQPEFSSAVSSTTKTLDQHRTRFSVLFSILNEKFKLDYSIPQSID